MEDKQDNPRGNTYVSHSKLLPPSSLILEMNLRDCKIFPDCRGERFPSQGRKEEARKHGIKKCEHFISDYLDHS